MVFGRTVKVEDFESAALPYYNELCRTAARVVGDSNEAEDVIQETYLQAWRLFHRFELGTNCRAWLFKILFNIIHRHRRKRFMHQMMSQGEELMTIEEVLPCAPTIFENVTDEEVLAALAKIPPPYREIVLLADVEEFSYKEIAETLRIPVGTVMSRLSRSRRLLRAELADFARSFGIKSAKNARREP